MMTEDQERFLACVEKTPECWRWTSSASVEGYGRFTLAGGERLQAHRAAWTMFVGEIPAGLVVMHLCDVPACVNVDHLVVGTRAANNYDCARKGRYVTRSLGGDFTTPPPRMIAGEKYPVCALRSADIVEMRAAHEHGTKIVDLAKRYSVSASTVRSIVQGRTWRHLLPAVSP